MMYMDHGPVLKDNYEAWQLLYFRTIIALAKLSLKFGILFSLFSKWDLEKILASIHFFIKKSFQQDPIGTICFRKYVR